MSACPELPLLCQSGLREPRRARVWGGGGGGGEEGIPSVPSTSCAPEGVHWSRCALSCHVPAVPSQEWPCPGPPAEAQGGVKPPWECHAGAQVWFYSWRFPQQQLPGCPSSAPGAPVALTSLASFDLLFAKMAELLHQPFSRVFAQFFSHSCQASLYL